MELRGIGYILILLYATIEDYKTLKVKDGVHVLVFLLAVMGIKDNTFGLLFGAFVIAVPFLVIAVKTNQLGGGDVKFIFVNGIFLGFVQNYIGILIGLCSVLVLYFILKALHKIEKTRKFPLIPHLSFGYIIVCISSQLLS